MSVDDNFGEFDAESVMYDKKEVLKSGKDYGKGVKVITNKVRDYYDQLTSYTYTDEITDEKITVPIPQRWHPAGVFKRIITHNKIGQYTGVVLIGMCLVKGSKVVLGDGRIVNIESLEPKSGDSINEYVQIPRDSNDNVIDKATKFFKFENKKTIEIITSSGKSVRGTHNHPLLVYRGGMQKIKNRRNPEWVNLDQIRKGDIIASVKNIPQASGYYSRIKPAETNFESLLAANDNGNGLLSYDGFVPKIVTPELASLMGYITGDGWVAKNGTGLGWCVTQSEYDLQPKLDQFFKSTFGDKKPYIQESVEPNSEIDGRIIHRTVPLQRVTYTSKNIATMMSCLKEKRIPEMVLCSPNNVLSSFLSWLFEADGSCINFETYRKDSKKTTRKYGIQLTSVNIDLLRDVQIALLRFGIASRVASREGHMDLYISRKNDVLKFIEMIGFQSNKKQKQSFELVEYLKTIKKEHGVYAYQDSVVDIIYHDEPVTVYDIHVPKTHQFITNGGMISHNSGCLVAGSKVILADGTARDIETFGKKSGEHINIPILNAYGEEEAATMFYKYKNKKIVDITTSNGTLLRGTYQHPLLTKNRGWVEMQYLRKGDVLQTANTIYTASKPEKIVQVIKRRKRETVYDIHVPDSNTFVTNAGIISQNSGKTTLTRMFLHRIHQMGENYIVKWFTGSDLTNIDKIIDSCIVGFPHILIFDDASYTLEDAGKADVARLANALTTIRHHIKSRVITFMNIHYSKATKKFFRNQHFTFLTSISTEEMGNYADLFKDKMNVIRAFSKIYNKLMLHGYFEVPISSETYQTLRYTTNEPFRVGLVAEISDLHFFMYAKESCATCDPETGYNQLKEYHRFLEELIAAEGAAQVRTTLEFFATIYEGHSKSYLNRKRQAVWRKTCCSTEKCQIAICKDDC